MRLATAHIEGSTRAIRIDDQLATPLPFENVGALLADADWRSIAAAGGPQKAAGDLSFAPLLPQPEKVICAGLNYRGHAIEAKREIPEHPILFAKYWRALIGPDEDIVLPPSSDAVDWEGELAVVIGRTVQRAEADEALDAIAGYTVANDVSMRDWQRRTPEMFQGKTFERSTPVGPVLVSGDEIGNALDLRLRCSVDDVVVQDASTAELIFGPAFLVAYVSTFITLVPGDLILTGTPSGVGGARKPPVYLQDGQTLRTWIEGIGELKNGCVADNGDTQ
jgi:acylpyruvate hydrolase